jgi:amino acid permease
MIFLEMMAEMKHPNDFIKSLLGAQSLIMVAYIVFGMVVYAKQGLCVRRCGDLS